ncbi:unnamed protein product [Rotaria sp. Silwood1]|nr:unnamed protein product [Rotaria sp. Silwood1]CAF3356661.1 unnamed protein product [Rotaria sp. Silwood1]CAF3357423.1 unnamed protein product [Rotaria sp. Silwood1]
MKNRRFIHVILAGLLGLFVIFIISSFIYTSPSVVLPLKIDYRRRPECTCVRSELPSLLSVLKSEQNDSQTSLCSQYATQRGPHQRIISISLFGPKENKMFQFNRSLNFLHELIQDLNMRYSDGFVLRIYHDNTINTTDIICPIECNHSNVDFCEMNHKLYIPPKIWRFIPAGDPLVDVMMSRDLDSALTKREREAVDVWLASNKSFHAMRDHPMHSVPMLGGMWGFRPSLNRNLSRLIHDKIHNQDLIRNYTGRADQGFLAAHIWPFAKASAIAHDSFSCAHGFGHPAQPFPTQRPLANETNCFVGCVRSCCGHGIMPFGQCPIQCRPNDHPEWIYC